VKLIILLIVINFLDNKAYDDASPTFLSGGLNDTLSFSRAAERCHVTQSALSTGLKQLEETLGVQLAERTRQSVIMTATGQQPC
jgi:hypothetical protein